jgi:parallel beta-helix repeat protein
VNLPSAHASPPVCGAFAAAVAVAVCVLVRPATAEPAAPGTYSVDQRHPSANDDNPGTREAPFKTIGKAAAVVAAGDTVVIRTGTYRESVTIEASGAADKPISFQPDVAANVIVTGADILTDWTKEAGDDNVFSTPWSHVFIGWNQTRAHPADDFHKVIGRAEQVFVQGYPLRQVLRREHLSRGSFFVDQGAKRLYVWSADNADLTKQRVEASTRTAVWEVKGEYIHTRGIRFRYAANQAQSPAVLLRAKGDVLEDCVCEQMNSIGALLGAKGTVARRCVFQDNGQMGFSAHSAHNAVITDCLVRNNNTKGWNRGWEAGGNKLVLCRGLVIERSQFLANRGNGIWFDIGNENCTVRNCLIADNEDAGIFYEISFGLHAHDNVIVGNGFADSPGAWGAESGISLSSSPNCVIERNLIVGNKEGFNFREQGRTTPTVADTKTQVPVWNHDQTIRNNVFAYNRDAQTWGWFDVLDERHWPPALQQKPADLKQGAPTTRLGDMDLDEKGWPVNVTLDKLKLTFADNLYATAQGQPLFSWGCAWRHNKRYGTLDDVRQELGLEQGSRCEPFVFADYLTRDFRVPADSPALKMKCYPEGAVPGVRLGVLQGQ